MATHRRVSGITVETQGGAQVLPAGGTRRGRTGVASAASMTEEQAILHSMQAQELDLVDAVPLAPGAPAAAARRSGAGMASAAAAGEAQFEVPLAAGEQAVLLVLQDGVYEWKLPDGQGPAPAAAPSARRGAARVATTARRAVFRVSLQSPAGGAPVGLPSRRRGLLTSPVLGRVVVFVFRFLAKPLLQGAVKFMERNVQEGVVVIAAPDPQTWATLAPGAPVSLPTGRAARVLMLVHGTFSSTVGSFGHLASHDQGRAFLGAALQHYDLVIGWDHRTLSVLPSHNAIDFAARLERMGFSEPPVVDAVGYSRGGLVLRSLIEYVLPSSPLRLRVRRAVFVGATNGGTELANPKNWHRLADRYTNLAAAGARAAALVPGFATGGLILSQGIRGVGVLVKVLASAAVTDGAVPGLAAMEPEGSFIREINREQPGQPAPPDTYYCAITTDFEPDTATTSGLPPGLLLKLADKSTDALFGKPNDLVVNVDSMTSIDEAMGSWIRERHDFGASATVHHCAYFNQPETARKLMDWFEVAPAAPAAQRRAGMRRAGSSRVPRMESAPPQEASPPKDVACFFRAQTDDEYLLGKVHMVDVTISREALGAVLGAVSREGKGKVKLAKPLIVECIPTLRVSLQDPEDGRVEVRVPAPGQPANLRFDLKPNEVGDAQVRVQVRQGPLPLVTLTLDFRVVPARSGAPVPVTVSGSVNDLPKMPLATDELRITQRRPLGGSTQYGFELDLPSLGLRAAFESPLLDTDPGSYVASIHTRIEARWAEHGSEKVAFARDLRAIGGELFAELFPLELKQLLWKHRKVIGGVQVLSSEPFIPWELVLLQNPAQRKPGPGAAFLGELGVVRWLIDGYPPEVLRLRKGRARYVIPAYAPPNALPGAQAEISMMEKRFAATAVTPRAQAVYALLDKAGQFDLLHFACHGETEALDIGAARLLMPGKPRSDGSLSQEDVLAATVRQQADLRAADAQPIVVLNACQSGRAGYTLKGLGGFAQAFVTAGAGVFVGSSWSVGDTPAYTFVDEFYAQFVDARQPLAVAAAAARKKARDEGDATWLAYVVYGHPRAVVKRA